MHRVLGAKFKMKNRFLAIVTLVVLGLSSCSKTDSSNDSNSTSEKSSRTDFSLIKDRQKGLLSIIPSGSESDGNKELDYQLGTSVDLTLIDERRIGKPSITYRIPQGYLTSKKLKKGGVVSNQVVIQTGLPDMKPRKAKTKIKGEPGSQEYVDSLKRFNDGIYIYLKRQKSIPEFGKNVRRMYESQYVEEASKFSDFVLYSDVRCGDDYCVGFDYFLTKKSYEGAWVLFRCMPDSPLVGCSATTVYRGWRIQYSIRRSQLDRWKEFDIAVRELLDSFYLKESFLGN